MTTLLAIGDMHLGRPPAAIPEDLRHRQDELGPEAAWWRAVDEAIRHRVQAVLLAGDLVDRGRDFFVAYGQLKSGIEKLAAANIPVVAVAGNHDTRVLPRLAEEIEQLELLGADGQWEGYRLDDLTILGWSFPQPQVRRSPLETIKPTRNRGPVIGLLHCDRDRPESAHAPVSSEQLEQAPVDAWLLGHIHRPDDLDSERPIGYLGSVTALRASETGPRGPWLIHVSDEGIAADHLPMAPLRYEELAVDCSKLDDAGQLGELILGACRERVQALDDSKHPPLALGLRIALTGHSAAAGALAAEAEQLMQDRRSWDEAGVACFMQKIELAVLPKLNLKRLARQTDPCGLLARHLLALDEPGSEEYERLIALGRESLAPVIRAREFRDLDFEPDDPEVAGWLKRAGRVALTRLVEQREASR